MVSGERLGFLCDFFEDFRRNFFDREIELEHGLLATAAPAMNFPVSPQKSDFGIAGEVKQERVLRSIKLLRESQ